MTDLRMSRWIACRRWIHVVLLGTVAAWWALCGFPRGSALIPNLEPRLIWIAPALADPFLFWVLPIAGIALIQIGCFSLDKTLLGQRWTVSDVLRLACWRTISPTVALLFVATGFDAIYNRSLVGILWLLAAAILAIVGAWRFRSAAGIKLQLVKGGATHKRAFVLAKHMHVPLKRVYVVPAGRAHT